MVVLPPAGSSTQESCSGSLCLHLSVSFPFPAGDSETAGAARDALPTIAGRRQEHLWRSFLRGFLILPSQRDLPAAQLRKLKTQFVSVFDFVRGTIIAFGPKLCHTWAFCCALVPLFCALCTVPFHITSH